MHEIRERIGPQGSIVRSFILHLWLRMNFLKKLYRSFIEARINLKGKELMWLPKMKYLFLTNFFVVAKTTLEKNRKE